MSWTSADIEKLIRAIVPTDEEAVREREGIERSGYKLLHDGGTAITIRHGSGGYRVEARGYISAIDNLLNAVEFGKKRTRIERKGAIQGGGKPKRVVGHPSRADRRRPTGETPQYNCVIHLS